MLAPGGPRDTIIVPGYRSPLSGGPGKWYLSGCPPGWFGLRGGRDLCQKRIRCSIRASCLSTSAHEHVYSDDMGERRARNRQIPALDPLLRQKISSLKSNLKNGRLILFLFIPPFMIQQQVKNINSPYTNITFIIFADHLNLNS